MPDSPPRHRLLDVEPEFGRLLSPERLQQARQELAVPVRRLPVGEWDGERLVDADPQHIGLLMLEGMVSREVVIADNVCAELIGPSDVIRPWHLDAADRLLRTQVRWNVLAPTRVAVLDRRFAAQLPRYPEINAVLLDRLNERAMRLATMQAISQLNRVDRRLVAFFWHAAERWGRVTGEGVLVPLALSHSLLGRLVGARRPTVSTALGELAERGELLRRDDGTWVITGEPAGMPLPEVTAIIRQRRRLLPADRPAQAQPQPARNGIAPSAPLARAPRERAHVDELRSALADLRASCARQSTDLEAVFSETRSLVSQAVELRERRRRAGAI